MRIKSKLDKAETRMIEMDLRLMKAEAKLDPLIVPMRMISRQEFQEMYPNVDNTNGESKNERAGKG